MTVLKSQLYLIFPACSFHSVVVPASVAKLCGVLVGRPTFRRVLMQCPRYTYRYLDLSENGAAHIQMGKCQVSKLATNGTHV